MIIGIIEYFKYIKFLFIICCLSFYFYILIDINIFLYYIETYIDNLRDENIFKLSNNYKLTLLNNFHKINNPKISIISSVFNSEKFILRYLVSIHIQNLSDIEIILIDDCSIDNSYKIIKKYQNKDKRIMLIKNKNNKGTFINRNIGVLFAKGKYLMNT